MSGAVLVGFQSAPRYFRVRPMQRDSRKRASRTQRSEAATKTTEGFQPRMNGDFTGANGANGGAERSARATAEHGNTRKPAGTAFRSFPRISSISRFNPCQ